MSFSLIGSNIYVSLDGKNVADGEERRDPLLAEQRPYD